MDSARWDGFSFRDDDIVICTPPKCGTTWTQMICALLIFGTPTFDRGLDVISPWLDMQTRSLESVLADLEAQTHRRFIKTHTPLDGLPWDDRVTYLCVSRDPRDAGMSWDNHMENLDVMAFIGARQAAVGLDDVADLLAQGPPPRPDSELERFRLWLENDEPPAVGISSLRFTLHHLSTFWEVRDRPNVLLVRYEDLKADLAGQMRRIAGRLGIEIDEARWPELVEAATFDRMKARAGELAPNTTEDFWRDKQQFFHKGSTGQWRGLLTADDLARYEERLAELAPPDLVSWIHAAPQVGDDDPELRQQAP